VTLAKGDTLAKLDPATKEPIPADRESYTTWEIAELTSSFSLPADARIEGDQVTPIPHDVYQVVLLRKVS